MGMANDQIDTPIRWPWTRWTVTWIEKIRVITKMYYWHLERCTFPSHADFLMILICGELWTIDDYCILSRWCNWALLLMHSCLILLEVRFEGQIEFIIFLNVFLCCHTWQLQIKQRNHPIDSNTCTDGVQAAFGCSMEALRTPGESTWTSAIARKCSRRERSYTHIA